MIVPEPVLVGLGAAAGAVLRHLVQRFFELRAAGRGGVAWGTAAVNVLGSFALGVLAGRGSPAWALALLGTGVCGGLTTFSAFAHESLGTAASGRRTLAAVRVLAEVGAALAACGAGLAVGAGLR